MRWLWVGICTALALTLVIGIGGIIVTFILLPLLSVFLSI